MLQEIHDRLPWLLQPPTEFLYDYLQALKFSRMAADTNGMLDPFVYRELNLLAEWVAHGNMLEVGAAHGGTSIAMGMGIKAAGTDSTLVTFEKGEGGSMAEYGDRQTNIGILRENLASYDVDDVVEVVPEHLERGQDLPDVVEEHAPYSLLCIDADGNLHRDFELFYDLLEPGAIVVVDDYTPRRDYAEQSEQYPLGGGKNARTFHYVNFFKEAGLLSELAVHGETFFGTKALLGEFDDVSEAELERIDEILETDRRRNQKRL